jgi:hypothetical protein
VSPRSVSKHFALANIQLLLSRRDSENLWASLLDFNRNWNISTSFRQIPQHEISRISILSNTLYPQASVLTSPTSGGRSVGIVRSQMMIMMIMIIIIITAANIPTFFFFLSRKFTIYSTNGAISKYVVRKHLCGAIIQ